MTDTTKISATDLRELRSAIRRHFELERKKISISEREFTKQARQLAGERYREDLARFDAAKDAVKKIKKDAMIAANQIADELNAINPLWRAKISSWSELSLDVSHRDSQRYEKLAYDEIATRAAAARHALDLAEHDVLKELLKDSISDTAQTFLDKLPTIETVLQIPALEEIDQKMVTAS